MSPGPFPRSARGPGYEASSVVISFGATASVRYREVVRSWEGPLWEVPLYYTEELAGVNNYFLHEY